MPAPVFVSHGSPMIALERDGAFARSLEEYGAKNRPRAVAVVSAHWQTPDLRVSAATPLIYDFGGFPDELYRIEYPAKGDPALAAEIARRTGARVEERGLDHGAWVPLRFLFPRADVPVVPVSLPRTSHEALRELGAKLAGLEGVLVLGSGGVVHNLGLLHWDDESAPVDPWAAAYDGWLWENIGPRFDHTKGPEARRAAPTTEHMDPIYVVIGASNGERGELIHEGWKHGNLSMRSFSMKPAAAR